MKRKIIIPVIFILIIVTVLILFLNKEKVNTITIGAAMPLSGDGAIYGVPQRNAAELAIEEIARAKSYS